MMPGCVHGLDSRNVIISNKPHVYLCISKNFQPNAVLVSDDIVGKNLMDTEKQRIN